MNNAYKKASFQLKLKFSTGWNLLVLVATRSGILMDMNVEGICREQVWKQLENGT